MCNDYLYISMEKSSSEQCSDWEASILSKEQIEYAALDVYAAIGLYKYFASKIAPGLHPNHIRTIMDDFINENYGPQRFQKI